MIFVVFVTPPPVPVTVMVRVPVVAVVATRIDTDECPDPGAGMVAGLKTTLTPVPSPEAVNAIAALKPPETVVETFDSPVAPRATVNVLGDAVIAKVFAAAVTVSVTVVVSVVLPDVPVTVMGYVPAIVVEATAIVMIEVPVPVIEVGLKVTVTPVG